VAAVADLITAEAQSQGIDPTLAIEVANAESGLDPNVPDSSAGAIGVFQLEPATASDLGVNPRDLNQNIHGGVTYLRMMLSQFGNVATALAAYNWGPSNVSTAIAQWGSNFLSHAPSETQAYVAKILRNLGQYSATVTPSSVANGISQLFAPSSPAAPGQGLSAIPGWVILTGIAVGVYILAEVLE
jgi:soluble lytic murein transglycosylase-like protein